MEPNDDFDDIPAKPKTIGIAWIYGIDETPESVSCLAVSSRDLEVSYRVEYDKGADTFICNCPHGEIYANREEPTLREARKERTFTDSRGFTRTVACRHEKLLARWITDRWEG